MQHNGWDHARKVTAGGTGLVGHAGVVLLRKAADQVGLTGLLSAALRKAGASPVFDRGIVLVSMAAAIALGAACMSDIAVLSHLAPVLGEAPSGPTVRRALDLAGGAAMLDRVARARARARAHVWALIEDTAMGFLLLVIAGKTLAGWLVIDTDATLVTAHRQGNGQIEIQRALPGPRRRLDTQLVLPLRGRVRLGGQQLRVHLGGLELPAGRPAQRGPVWGLPVAEQPVIWFTLHHLPAREAERFGTRPPPPARRLPRLASLQVIPGTFLARARAGLAPARCAVAAGATGFRGVNQKLMPGRRC